MQRKARQEGIMNPSTLFFYSGVELANRVATPAHLDEQGVSTSVHSPSRD
jgi:hypothetical protein